MAMRKHKMTLLMRNSVHHNICTRSWTGQNNLDKIVGRSSNFVRRFELSGKLKGHTGCVNTACFTDDGKWIITGSDDLKLMLWDSESYSRKISFNSGHTENIFSAKVMPFTNNEHVVSCAADGVVRWANLEAKVSKRLIGHIGRAHRLVLEPGSPHTFFSCGEDGAVYFFDLRCDITDRRKKLMTLQSAREKDDPVSIFALSVDPMQPTRIILAGSDPYVYLFDIRRLQTSERQGRSVTPGETAAGVYCPRHLRQAGYEHVTGAVFDWSGREAVATYNDELVYRFGLSANAFDPSSPSSSAGPGDKADETTPLLATAGAGGAPRAAADKESKKRARRRRRTSAERVRHEERAMAAAAASGGEEEEEVKEDEHHSEEEEPDPDQNSDHMVDSSEAEEQNEPSIIGKDGSYLTKYEGHRNAQTVKQVNFFGPRSEYVVSGSDCGHIFIWERESGLLETMLHGDRIGAVNCLEAQPGGLALVTSGLEHDAKIWRPTRAAPVGLLALAGAGGLGAEEVMERNRRRRAQRAEPEPAHSLLLSLLLSGGGSWSDNSDDADGSDNSNDGSEDRPARRRRRRAAGGGGGGGGGGGADPGLLRLLAALSRRAGRAAPRARRFAGGVVVGADGAVRTSSEEEEGEEGGVGAEGRGNRREGRDSSSSAGDYYGPPRGSTTHNDEVFNDDDDGAVGSRRGANGGFNDAANSSSEDDGEGRLVGDPPPGFHSLSLSSGSQTPEEEEGTNNDEEFENVD